MKRKARTSRQPVNPCSGSGHFSDDGFAKVIALATFLVKRVNSLSSHSALWSFRQSCAVVPTVLEVMCVNFLLAHLP